MTINLDIVRACRTSLAFFVTSVPRTIGIWRAARVVSFATATRPAQWRTQHRVTKRQVNAIAYEIEAGGLAAIVHSAIGDHQERDAGVKISQE